MDEETLTSPKLFHTEVSLNFSEHSEALAARYFVSTE